MPARRSLSYLSRGERGDGMIRQVSVALGVALLAACSSSGSTSSGSGSSGAGSSGQASSSSSSSSAGVSSSSSASVSSSSSSSSSSGGTTQSVGPDGGTVALSDGTSVQIPAGALGAVTAITITPDPSAPPPDGGIWVGTPYLFGPEGTQFASPVTVTLPFVPSELPGDAGPDGIAIDTAPAGSTAYVALATTVVDTTHVSAQTSHFSAYGPAIDVGDQVYVCDPPCSGAGMTCCYANLCTNLGTNPSDCGRCGHECAAMKTCVNGACCGSVGYICETNQSGCCSGLTCSNGQVCAAPSACGTCESPTSTCCGTTCVDTQTDNDNCGGCAGAEGVPCPSGLEVCCGGSCIPEDASNCGTCGVACTTGITPACCNEAGASSCTDTSSDPNNCGSCGHICPSATPACTAGKCAAAAIPCASGTCTDPTLTCCNNECVNTYGTDPSNCGSCGNTCQAASPDCCSGTCTNTQTDPKNCGTCQFPCGEPTSDCESGGCQLPPATTLLFAPRMNSGYGIIAELTPAGVTGWSSMQTTGSANSSAVGVAEGDPSYYLYVGDSNNGGITTYQIYPGAITPTVNLVGNIPGLSVYTLAVTPNGSYVYAVADAGTAPALFGFSVGDGGVLTPLSPATAALATGLASREGPGQPVIDPTSSFLYSEWSAPANYETAVLGQFSIAAGGQVAALSPATVSPPNEIGSGWQLPSLAINGSTLYVSGLWDLSDGGAQAMIAEYSLQANGTLAPQSPATAAADMPTPADAGVVYGWAVNSIAVATPDGGGPFVYLLESVNGPSGNDDYVGQFTGTSGTLVPSASPAIPTCTNAYPFDTLTVDPYDNLLLVSCQSAGLEAFAIAADGSLTQTSWSPVNFIEGPAQLFVLRTQ